jgi:peptide/nickel transport system ATP-binding protein
VPDLEVDVERLASIEGQPPALDDLPPGCSFAPRCPYAREVCTTRRPAMIEVNAGHAAACWKLNGYGG